MTGLVHLPNAAHIDRVLASVKIMPKHWGVAQFAAIDNVRRSTQHSVRMAAWNILVERGRSEIWMSAEWQTVYNETGVVAWDSMNDTLLALIAYDDCAYMLDSDPGELAILAAFGDPRAGMLLLACNAFHSLKTIA